MFPSPWLAMSLSPKLHEGTLSKGWWWQWWHKGDMAPSEPIFPHIQFGKGMEKLEKFGKSSQLSVLAPEKGLGLCLLWKSCSCRVWVWRRAGILS